jgi:hypothetical protein
VVFGPGGELFKSSGGHMVKRTSSGGPRGDYSGFLLFLGGGDGPREGELEEDEGGEER